MEAQVKIVGPQFSNFVRSVILACEEKGISYHYGMKIDGEAIQLGDDLNRQYHPFGKIPVLMMGDHSLCETASIIRYLDAEFSGTRLQPEDNYQRALVDQWSALVSIYIDQAIVRMFLLEFIFPKGEGGTVRMDYVEAAIPKVKEAIAVLNQQIGTHDYLCGEQFSMADILLIPMLDYLAKHPMGSDLIGSEGPVVDYIERIRQRPSSKILEIDGLKK